MKTIITIVFLLLASAVFGQDFKEDISVVQFSASFVKDSEIDLKKFKDCSTYTFYIEKDNTYFVREEIEYLPTVLVYQNGKEIMRVETGISMAFPEGTDKKIKKKVEELIGNKF
tara:strand:+ start:190 stop:531 length:342 start_codon:yes stop_codon:yes gene_type:complete